MAIMSRFTIRIISCRKTSRRGDELTGYHPKAQSTNAFSRQVVTGEIGLRLFFDVILLAR